MKNSVFLQNVKVEPTASPDKKKTKRELAREQEQKEVWKWWEEEKTNDGKKWKTLEHMGPVFAPEYEPLPKHVKLVYDGSVLLFTRYTIGYCNIRIFYLISSCIDKTSNLANCSFLLF